MGKITEICYKEIDEAIMDPTEAGQFYFYHNLLNHSDIFHEDYMKSESSQIKIRNSTIADIIRNGEIGSCNINVASSFLGISSLKNKVVLVAEIK